ncbi:hypothetical protein PMZ80_008526 [Knufia obscura]|uniref:MT-A70-domain-containing protein n=1 Tax=Knufia obscura TaxID=1635080 RepID=A0ABR0RF41_9EURO|nr:hypothetical protein PMZ80_008526 [Knufia obscura]
MSQAILFSSHEQTTFLVDLPESIGSAQGGGRIYSSLPVVTPFVTPEPKGSKRDAFIAKLPQDHVAHHNEIQSHCERALTAVEDFPAIRQWCLPRMQSLGDDSVAIEPATAASQSTPCLPLVLSSMQNDFVSVHDIQNELVHNDNTRTAYLVFKDNASMLVPGHSTFMWSSVERGLNLMSAKTSTVYGKHHQFDLILMDPPWANRSVRNSQKYHTSEEQWSDPFEKALPFIDYLSQSDGHAAIWITNKAAIRDQVLAAMAQRGLHLVEEWIWLKITIKGEPITPLNGVWRKPYELLLIFGRVHTTATPTRRVIVAAPDMHSRKPNLKSLFEKLFRAHRVLELFARNLTSGWWCIGDEVLKFQDTRLWHKHPP